MSTRREKLINEMIASQVDKKFLDCKSLNEGYRIFSVMLSDEGWYLDYELAVKTIQELYIHQITKNSKVLDEYMIAFYKKKLSQIIEFFKKHHQSRFPFLEKAFYAHEKGDFEMSIPVFLAQIEGVFYDLTEKEIFSKGRGKKDNTAKEWINSKESSQIDFRLSILEPLKQNENISANFKESKDFPNVLNRNRILHGRDLNYANEMNSFKAISLLFFIGTIVYDFENDYKKIKTEI